MDVFGVISGFVTNNVGNALIGGASGIILLQLYKLLKGFVNPSKYILDMYDLGDKVIINFDNKFIDKYLPSTVKQQMQKDIIDVLKQRKGEIDSLIEVISD